MNRPQLIRRLRIAVSVFFAVVTVALCVLWVRSYYFGETWEVRTQSSLYQVQSMLGEIWFWQQSPKLGPHDTKVLLDELSQGKLFNSFKVKPSFRERMSKIGRQGFEFSQHGSTRRLGIPYWLLACVPLGIAIVPWILQIRRFSLRTLLIATTLVAVVLGLGVWAAG